MQTPPCRRLMWVSKWANESPCQNTINDRTCRSHRHTNPVAFALGCVPFYPEQFGVSVRFCPVVVWWNESSKQLVTSKLWVCTNIVILFFCHYQLPKQSDIRFTWFCLSLWNYRVEIVQESLNGKKFSTFPALMIFDNAVWNMFGCLCSVSIVLICNIVCCSNVFVDYGLSLLSVLHITFEHMFYMFCCCQVVIVMWLHISQESNRVTLQEMDLWFIVWKRRQGSCGHFKQVQSHQSFK